MNGNKNITKAEIERVRAACQIGIYGKENEHCTEAPEKGLAILSEIIGIFPVKLFTSCPELETLYKNLENREVKIRK